MSTNDLLEFVKQIQSMIGDSMLGKDVYSKQYFSSIIRSMYYTIPDSEDVVIVYGDFNGLGNINIKHGHEAGDFAVTESLKTIREIMPENTLMCRIAGDEFAFIIPKETKSNIKPYMEQINSTLKNKAKDLYGLSIALAAVDTHSFGSDTSYFDLLYSAVETAVENQKRVSREHPVSTPEELLSQKFLIASKRFIDYYRFDDVQLEERFIKTLRDNLPKIVSELCNQPPTHNINNYSQISKNKNEKPDFPKEVATKIHSILTSKTITSDQVSEIPLDTWQQLFDHLIRHPLTGLFSKKYFQKVLAPEIINNSEASDLVIHLFDIMHMKLSNDLHGHAYTDEQMKIIIDSIKTSVLEENLNATFVMNGGSVIVIEEKAESHFLKAKIPETSTVLASSHHGPVFKEYNDPCYNLMQKATKGQETLNLAHSSITCKPEELFNALDQLKLKILNVKKQIKAHKMTESQTMSLAIKTAFTDAINYYLTEFSNATAQETQQTFLIPTLLQSMQHSFSATLNANRSRKSSPTVPDQNAADPR